MEMHEAEVAYRIEGRLRLADALRVERRQPVRRRLGGVRAALGRRLIALGAALLDDHAPRPIASA